MSALLPSAEPAAVTVGVDLGGTGTRIAALGHDGVVLRHVTTPTATGIPPAQAIADLAHAITTATADLEIQGIGIGATGPVDAHGVIRNPETLPAFSDVDITSILSDRLGAAVCHRQRRRHGSDRRACLRGGPRQPWPAGHHPGHRRRRRGAYPRPAGPRRRRLPSRSRAHCCQRTTRAMLLRTSHMLGATSLPHSPPPASRRRDR